MQVADSEWKFSDPIWAILESVPSMLAYWDTDLQCRFANKAYESWFGVTGISLFGSSLKDLLGPTLFALNEPYILGALRGEPQRFERLVPGPGGVNRPSLASYIPHFVDGRVAGFVVEVTDVSALFEEREGLKRQVGELKHVSGLLQRTEAALKDAQRLAETGSWHWEVDTDIMTWSDQLYELFGLNPAMLPPNYAEHSSLFPTSSWLRLEQAVLRALAFGDPYVLELEFFHSSGRRGWLESRCTVERDEQGKIVGLLGTARDITALHRDGRPLEQDRRIDELEAALATATQRTRTLEAAFTRARALEAVGTMTAGISHDFNNVLSALTGALQVLKLTTAEERSRSLAERGQQAVNRAASLVRQLMDISKVHAPATRVVNLGDLLRDCLDFFRVAAGSRVQVVLESLNSACVLVDAYQLEVALLNLVINARDAMPTGGVLTFKVTEEPNEGHLTMLAPRVMVGVSVQDTGSGMSQGTLARAREPFFSTKGDNGGTGLGLPMVHAFAQAAGGSFVLESTLGSGTTATILLPMAEAADDHGALTTDEPVDHRLHGNATIVLVDDDDLAPHLGGLSQRARLSSF
ncbi:PAS domain-containing protein [Variovorax sp. N23]|uniref:PAS domain-containing sensor histidine kinase n=1 Tax=Variovorax sp. N23 TaxID=2980555 RepID=UPI0021C920D6|nr:PAS domain-containing protein [Variovorax sp. N23]MCU4119034.1 PAS domain-containing protein [Variovorax sp. N23]